MLLAKDSATSPPRGVLANSRLRSSGGAGRAMGPSIIKALSPHKNTGLHESIPPDPAGGMPIGGPPCWGPGGPPGGPPLTGGM